MRLLVTGGAGYIGSVVSAVLLERGHDVTVLDDLSTGHADAVPSGATLVRSSIADASVIADGWDGVLHFAAKSLVGESVEHPERYWANNVVGSFALLDAVRLRRIPRLVFSSTAAVYGEPATVPIREDAPTRPTNPYGASKLAIDHMLTSFAVAHGLAAVSLRYFNVAGAYGRFGERHDTETHLVPNVLRALEPGAEPVPVFGRDYPTPDGTAVRDFIHVLDLADAHVRALEAAVPGRHAVYNLGTGTGSSVLEVLSAVAEVAGQDVPRADHPRRAGDPAVLVADGSLAGAELGWAPTRSLQDMVSDALAFRRLQSERAS
jgi:UDP-glucose 4-epimerase